MERDTYLVLRLAPTEEPFDPLRGYAERSFGAGDAAPVAEYQVETRSLDQRDLADAHRDPRVAALARPMPLHLIQPVTALGAAEAPPAHIHDATWGVYVTGALQSPYVGNGVTVAILDTGIDAGHEAFEGVELVEKDFTGEGNGDRHGHGTHVAGTIFGRTKQGVRIGVAPGVPRALIGKVLGQERSATTAELVSAIQWAVEAGAHVFNMSLGFDFPGLVRWWVEQKGMEADLATSQALAQYRGNVRFFDRLMGLLRARGATAPTALVVAAAGNESRRRIRPDYVIEVSPPAAAEGVLSVAALQSTGTPHDALSVAPFSNVNAAVAAPGMGVYSALKGGDYTTMNGTSMASPHVAGVAALWAEWQLQRQGAVNAVGLDAKLRGTANTARLPNATYSDVGDGLVTAPAE